MTLKDLKKYKIPDSPGVYFFKIKKGQSSEILYIGKATSLKDRLKSYFTNDLIKARGPAIVDMVTKSNLITFEKTESVLEALILESNLIKKHQPKYNVKEKDNRSYYKVITTAEKYPRVLLVRERQLKFEKNLKIRKEFGPYPNSNQITEALKIIRKIFPYFDTKKPVSNFNSTDIKRIGLKISLNLYPDVFNQKVSQLEYLQNIKNIEIFLSGKKKDVLKNLKKQMLGCAKKQQFEKAQEIKRRIFALEHLNDTTLIKKEVEILKPDFRIEAYDVAHLKGQSSVGVMVVFENNMAQKNLYKKFILRQTKKSDDYGGLNEILSRRLKHSEWTLPNLIVIDGGKGQINTALKVLKEQNLKIDVVSVVKDDKHKAREILGSTEIVRKYRNLILQSNSEAHRFAINFHRFKLRQRLS